MHDHMVFVQGGLFLMGDPSSGGFVDTLGVHEVRLDDFHIGKFPVTRELWYEVTGENIHEIKNPGAPKDMVSWYEAVEFCNRLSLQCGLEPCYEIVRIDPHTLTIRMKVICHFHRNGFRLPTEAEWEYAARGGRKTRGYRYAGSDEINLSAWYKNNSRGILHDAGLKKPNELGLYDMSGNLWEWCQDWYGEYPGNITGNPAGPHDGETKVYRGGSFLDFDYACTVFVRGHRKPDLRQTDIGFRLVRAARGA